jgi:hypothetical protein
MKRGTIPDTIFQTFHISKEKTNCPLIPELIRISKKLKEKKILSDDSSLIISFRYGKRILINGNVEDYSKMRQDELFEVADYDPVKNVLMIIGPGEPRLETPVHYMIHHARKEVNAIIQINNSEFYKKIKQKYPIAEDNYAVGSLEYIKEVLKKLHYSKIIILKNQGILIIGETYKKVEESAYKLIEEIK